MECEKNTMNYMIIYYGNESEYKHGFCRGFNKEIGYTFVRLSDNINFIIHQNDNSKKIGPNDELIIESGTKITIYFSSPLTELVNFLNANNDQNKNNFISIDLSHLNLSSLYGMDGLFRNLISLKYVDLKNLNMSKITDMGSMFYGCTALETMEISYLDTSSVEDMGSMFYGCTALKTIKI